VASTISVPVIGALAGLLVLATVLKLIVRRQLRFRYSGFWLTVSSAVAVIAIVPGLLERVSSLLGFQVPANFLFFVGMILLLLVGIHLSVTVTRLEDRIQRLAEEHAILAERIRHD
jgi:hypothetical protein